MKCCLTLACTMIGNMYSAINVFARRLPQLLKFKHVRKCLYVGIFWSVCISISTFLSLSPFSLFFHSLFLYSQCDSIGIVTLKRMEYRVQPISSFPGHSGRGKWEQKPEVIKFTSTLDSLLGKISKPKAGRIVAPGKHGGGSHWEGANGSRTLDNPI